MTQFRKYCESVYEDCKQRHPDPAGYYCDAADAYLEDYRDQDILIRWSYELVISVEGYNKTATTSHERMVAYFAALDRLTREAVERFQPIFDFSEAQIQRLLT